MRTDGVEVFRFGLLCLIQIPTQLQVHPKVRRHAEILCEAKRDAGVDAFPLRDYFLDALVRHVNGFGQLLFVDLHWRKELFAQHFAWVCGRSICGKANHESILTRSVVINNFDLIRPGVSPNEAKPVLIVDPNAVLPFTVCRQGF